MPSTDQARRAADAHDRVIGDIAKVGTRPLASISIRVRAAALQAWRDGHDPVAAIRGQLRPMASSIAQAMTAAHVSGFDRAHLAAEGSKRMPHLALARDFEDLFGRWKKIAEFAALRAGLTDGEVEAIAKRYTEEAISTVGELGGVLEAKVREVIAEAAQRGLNLREGMAALRTAFDAAGLTNANPFLIETTMRTQAQLAFSAGKLQANEDPAIQEILWGYEYTTVGDDRVRPGHAALDGLRLPKDHPRWREIMPPNGYNCRCTAIEIFNDEAIATPVDVPEFVNVNGARVRAGADDGWEFSPLELVHTLGTFR